MTQPTKRQKMSQETNHDDDALPQLPKKDSKIVTTVFEYFKHPYFFEGEVSQKFLDQRRELWIGETRLYEFFEKGQMEMDVYVEILACLGCIPARVFQAFQQWAEEAHRNASTCSRMTSEFYQIPDTNRRYTDDLDYFSQRVEDLFEWFEERNPQNKCFGPYLCLVQSSGMGKTKLLYDYKMALASHDPDTPHDMEPTAKESTNIETVEFTQKEARVAIFLILLTSCGFEMEKWKSVFDYQWNLEKLIKDIDPLLEYAAKIAADRIFDELDKKLTEICQQDPNCNRIVLLLDESPRLLGEHFGYDAFLFRCVRMWLRQERANDDLLVVAVFAGTNFRITTIPLDNEDVLERSPKSPRFNPLLLRIYHDSGCNFNPPLYHTMTMGSCLALLEKDVPLSEYARSVYYGRPLFALMAQAGILDSNISSALRRMLLVERDFKKWNENHATLIHFLSTRLPLGLMNTELTSELVAKGFANLVCQRFELPGCYHLAHFPDPVCARLAMCMMDQDFTCQLPATWNTAATTIKGRNKRWWTQQLTKIFGSGMVRPQHDGNVGRVLVALYLLFCADLLRKEIDRHPTKGKRTNKTQPAYSHFSVSLDDWLQRLQSGGTLPSTKAKGRSPKAARKTAPSGADNAGNVSVGFIQICRNSLDSYGDSWKNLAHPSVLQQAYASGAAFDVYSSSPLIDMVIPMRVNTETESVFEFVPMFVAIKCECSFSLDDAETVCREMVEKATDDKLDRALCLLIVFGSGSTGDSESETPPIKGVSDELFGSKRIVSRIVFVPRHDDFGLHNAWEAIAQAQVDAGLFVSHPYFLAHGFQDASEALRQFPSEKFSSLLDAVRGNNVQDQEL